MKGLGNASLRTYWSGTEPSADSMYVAAPATTVKPFGNVMVPPPGNGFVTEISRVPRAASKEMTISILICVELTAVREFTLIPDPIVTVVPGVKKFVPANERLNMLPRVPEPGVTDDSVGGGFSTLKTKSSVAFPPPGEGFVAVTLLAPTTAVGDTVIFTVIAVGLPTDTLLTVIPTPNVTVVTPATKFVPVRLTFAVCPLPAPAGVIVVNVGTGFMIVNAFANGEAPPPGAGFVTVTALTPARADCDTVMVADMVVPAVSTEIELAITPAPKSTLLTPVMKHEPVRTTPSVCPRTVDAGATESSTGAEF